MFTLIGNYKTLFMMCIASNLGEKLSPSVDTDGDGDLDMVDINRFSPETQEAIKRVLGDTNMRTLEEGRRFSLQSLIENGFVVERAGTISEATAQQQEHRQEVASNNTGERLAMPDITSRPHVRGVQQYLKDRGFTNPNGSPLAVDGSWGPNTQAAFDAFNGGAPAATETRTQAAATPRETTGGRERMVMPDITSRPQVRGVQQYLKDRGFTNPNGSPLVVDGSWGPNTQAAFDAFNGGLQSGTETANVPSRNFFQQLGDFFTRGGEAPTSMAGIDMHINATNRELNDLDRLIQEATSTGNAAAINTAHAQAMQLLRGKISNELYTTLSQANNTVAKNRVLDYISNALMGSARTVEIAQGRLGAREYATTLEGLKNSTVEVLRSEGVSEAFIAQTIAQMDQAIARIGTSTQFTYGVSDAVASYSVRSKGANRGLQPFSRGTTEKISINGINEWEITESQQDVLAFINNMSPAQIRDIDQELRNNTGVLTKERLADLYTSGQVGIDINMIIAHNCGNVSYELDITERIQPRDTGGGNDGPGDGPDTTPGGEGAPSTSPGGEGAGVGSPSGETAGDNGGQTSGSESSDNGAPQ